MIRKIAFLALAGALAGPGLLNCQPEVETLLIVGAGKLGGWDTVFEVANPETTPATVTISYPSVRPGLCPPICPVVFPVVVPGNGTVAISASSLPAFGEGVRDIEINRSGGGSPPVASARWVNRLQPDRTFGIPVVRRSTLTAASPSVLSFAGAAQTPSGAYSNLVLAHQFGPATLLVEAFSASGIRLGAREISIDGSSVVLYRVLEPLDVTDTTDALLRVTRTSGEGAIWGYLVTVDENGGIRVSAGRNL